MSLRNADIDRGSLEIAPVLDRLLGGPVRAIERISGGGNSQVFRVTGAGGEQYAAKRYFRHPLDGRDRLRVEFESLRLLWRHCITSVPRPIAADYDAGWGIYSYCEGEPLLSAAVGPEEIDGMVEFLAALKTLAVVPGAQGAPEASEACFSGSAIIANIHRRREALSDINVPKLAAFLAEEFRPSMEWLASWAAGKLARAGQSLEYTLKSAEKTLSPSDFGCHNAIRARDGHLMFVDFEYFGWDDPAKTIADFLLHPAMGLNHSLKERFRRGMLDRFERCGPLAERVQAVLPLFALKWCLILLNEFLPHHARRRGFAAQGATPEKERERQLLKARRMLQTAWEFIH